MIEKSDLVTSLECLLRKLNRYLPQISANGSWHLITRGDSNILAEQVAASFDSEQVVESMDIEDALLTTTFNSSIPDDEVFSELDKR